MSDAAEPILHLANAEPARIPDHTSADDGSETKCDAIELGSRWIPGWWYAGAPDSLQSVQPIGPVVVPIDFRG